MNIALFIPFAIFLSSILSYKFKRTTCIIVTITLGMLLSTSIETFQFITRRGETEVDDVIFNTLGSLIGSIVINYKNIKNKIIDSRFFHAGLTKFYALTFIFSWTLWAFVSYMTTHVSHTRMISTILFIIGGFAPLLAAVITSKSKTFLSSKINAKSVIYFATYLYGRNR